MSSGGQIGSLAGGIIGGVAGSFIPGGTMLGFSIGSMIGGMAGNAISPTKGPHSAVSGPRLGDLSVQSSSYGGPIPIIYGTVGQVAGNVIWQTPIVETTHTSSSSSGGGGGKGGAPQQSTTTTSYTYSVSMAVGLAAGPIGGVKRMWANGKLVWDALNPVPNGPITGFRVYYGNETQVADPTIEADLGVGNVPAYRGLAYVVFTNLELGPFNNSVPNFSFELIGQGTPAITTTSTNTSLQNSLVAPRAAIDTATGLIWLIEYHYYPGPRIYVIRPDTWAIVQTVILTDSTDAGIRAIVYQPAYTIGSTAVPARMWIGGHSNNNQLFVVDTASYAVTVIGFTTPSGQASNGMAIDLSALGSDGVATGTINILFGGQKKGTAPYYTELNSLDTSQTPALVGMAVPQVAADFTALGGLGISEGISGGGSLYVVDRRGQVFQFNSSLTVTASYLLTDSGETDDYNAYHVTYNPDEDAIYVTTSTAAGGGGHSVLYKFDTSLAVLWTRDFYPDTAIDVKYQRGSGSVWVTTSTNITHVVVFRTINLSDGSDIQTVVTDCTTTAIAGAGAVGFALPYPNADFMVLNNAPTTLKKVPLIPVASGSTTLDAIVSDLSVRSALSAGDIDVTGLGSLPVLGYMISTRTTVRAAIEPLCRAFFFDGVESDSKVKFSLRGATSSLVTIPSTEVAAYAEGGTPPDPLAQAHAQEADLPNEVEVTYPDVTVDYRPVLQYARRLRGYSEEKMAMQIPVVCTASQALLIANVLLYVAWTERDTYTLSIIRKYAYLDPADLITYSAADGTTTVMRITKIDFAFPLLLKMEAVKEDPSIYAGFTYAAGVGGYVSEPLTSAVPTVMYLGDWPILQDVDNNAGFYVSGRGVYSGWTGSSTYKSIDAGASYAKVGQLTDEVAAGYATTVLATVARPELWDDVSTVTVTMVTGSLISAVDDYEVYAGGNAAMLGDELIQFGTVVSLGGGAYTLSHLLRGRNGTEWAVGTHALSDTFILLADDGTITRQSAAVGEIGLSRLYKAASPGQYLADVPAVTFTNTGVGLKPYAPCSIAATRDGSLNVTLTWIRRTRIGGAWRDLVDVPLGEDTESYSIDVMNGASVVRTLTATTETVGYTAAQQTTDFGSAQAAILFHVYQISAQVGRGYVGAATV
jgi:hypothetical protein